MSNYEYNETKTITNQMEVDHKIVKRIYPRTNNLSCLEFVLEKDPNLFLRMYSMKLIFKFKFPSTYMLDAKYGAKMFSDLRIDIDSQGVNSSNTK
jgi:hypothetical protein